MTGKEYQILAMRTNDGKCSDRLHYALIIFKSNAKTNNFFKADLGGVINASLGLSGETGELNDMIKKAIFHGHALDMAKVKKELGDICWYVAMMCESFGLDLDDVMKTNIDKLLARYPDGFSEERSQHRKEGDI